MEAKKQKLKDCVWHLFITKQIPERIKNILLEIINEENEDELLNSETKKIRFF